MLTVPFLRLGLGSSSRVSRPLLWAGFPWLLLSGSLREEALKSQRSSSAAVSFSFTASLLAGDFSSCMLWGRALNSSPPDYGCVSGVGDRLNE